MSVISITLLILAIHLTAFASDIKSFTINTDAFLKKYVMNGQVAYARLKQNVAEAENLYHEINMMNLSKSHEGEKKAFYINAYNIIVIYAVVKHFPIKSPMEKAGFFDTIKYMVAGESLTLNELERKKLLQPYRDGRFHFVLVCAARSCPSLANFAYTPEKIEGQLTERTALTLNDKDWLKVYPKQKRADISKIFEWYSDDFKSGGKTVLDWINQFRKEKIPSSYTVGFYEYDWSLNTLK